MNVSAEKIRKDILKLYTLLYPQSEEERAGLNKVISGEIIRLLKYEPSAVEDALMVKNGGQRVVKRTKRQRIEDIVNDKEDVRQYFADHFADILDPSAPEAQVAEQLSQITLGDLKYLYSRLIDVPLNGKISKKELVYKIQEFFDSEKRTSDLAKNLY